MEIRKIQEYLQEHSISAWLMADFHGRNSVAAGMLQLSNHITRRSFFLIRAEGEPIALVHSIEQDKFQHLPGKKIIFSSYKQLESNLEQMLQGLNKIAMEYSPKGRLPYVGLVEAGTIELVRDMGKEIVSSADMVALFQAALTVEQIALHRIAAHNVIDVKCLAFEHIKQSLQSGTKITEHDVVQFILAKFEELDMETEHAPNCSVGANAGNPHYEPRADSSAEIVKGQIVLIDLWARLKQEGGIYADITWIAFAGTSDEIPEKYKTMFKIITDGRDAAVSFLREHIGTRPVLGAEADDACRKVIADAGYGDLFTHRTGHSIHADVHGPGPNIDNLETEDQRKLQPGHLFSIEPGIYSKEFGMRTEIDVLIGYNGVEVTTLPLQTDILPLID